MPSKSHRALVPLEPPAPVTPLGSRAGRLRRPWLGEVILFALALVIYEASRMLVIGDAARAFSDAATVINLERGSGLFVELSVQQWLLTHLELTRVLNEFYLVGHWTITPLFFVWLYRTRRTLYPYVRNAFLTANGIALVIFVVFPVAPPRLLTPSGFVDTLGGVSKVDLHGGVLSGWFNPYAAVPSMHFGYAFMIGVVAAFLLHNWTLRFLALTYPALVFLTITGTANHYVADSLVGALVIAAGFVLVQCWASMWPRVRPAIPLHVRYSRSPQTPPDRPLWGRWR